MCQYCIKLVTLSLAFILISIFCKVSGRGKWGMHGWDQDDHLIKTSLLLPIYYCYMWHDQEEWVRCRRYWFWDIGKNSVQIPLFYIGFLHWQILHNSATRYPIVMGFASKWSFLKLWESGVRKWELTHFPWSCHILKFYEICSSSQLNRLLS